jgi:hypothetical protein
MKMTEVETKAALAAEYLDLIGYDPFEDDPEITVEEVAANLADYKVAVAAPK